MINHDFRCTKCGLVGEALVESGTRLIDCQCGGVAALVYLKAPGVLGKEKGIYPYTDHQLGQTFHSKAEKQAFLKKERLHEFGAEEHAATLYQAPSVPALGEEQFIDKAAWREAALKADHQIRSQEVPLQAAPTITETEADPVVAA